ncbi:MAG: leucine-rich repeat domain-containing protein [Paludibacteraceae bacterium]|nr:leucine-rich repeat domain-containing protein [Paludibacteraceae bacterium]
MRRLFTFLLALTVSVGTLFAESGTCGADGDNLTWDLTDGVLTISGTGAMADWYSDDPSWKPYRSLIQSVIIEDGVTCIGAYAFWLCSALTSVTISNSVLSIGQCAFNACYVLSSITIPTNVSFIGERAFYGCTGLTEITCEATTPPTCSSDCFGFVDKSVPLYVPAGTKAAYKEADEWKEFNIQEMTPAGTVTYELVDLSTETLTAGQYLIVFDDNKAHAAVSGKDLIASSDELTFEDDYAFVPEEAVCAVTIAPLGTDSFSILLADGTSYMDQTAKNSVTTSANPSAFAITDGGDRNVKIGKYLASESKTFILQHNTTSGNYFRMYSSTNYTLPKLYRKVAAPVPTGLDHITNDQSPMTNKVLRDGQVFILRDGKTYNVMGVEVR